MASPQLLRTRLLSTLSNGRLGVVEAGGGYGKSVLADQLRRQLGFPTAFVALRPRDADPALLSTTLLQSLRAARLSDLAAAVEGRPGPEAAVDALAEALAATAEPVQVVVDDAHHLQGEAVAALDRLASVLPTPHRFLALGRSVPSLTGGAQPGAGFTRLTGSDLSFSPEEIERYLFEVGSQRLSDLAVATIHRSTGDGRRPWPCGPMPCHRRPMLRLQWRCWPATGPVSVPWSSRS